MPQDRSPSAYTSAMGPLQLRIMHLLWRSGEMTVYDVASALNGEPDSPRLAYTTFLTVMRNLVRRGLLLQRKAGSEKAHRFSAAIGEDRFKSAFLRQICKEYCASDPQRLLGYLQADFPAPAG